MYIYGEATNSEKIWKLQTPAIVVLGPGGNVKNFENIQAMDNNDWRINRNFSAEDDLYRIGAIKFRKKLKVVEPTEASLDIQSFAGPPEGSERLARLVITNNGNGKASIGKLTARGKEIKMACDDRELEAGESAECVSIVDRNDRMLRLAYSEQPCGKPKINVLALSLSAAAASGEGESCEANEDCSTGEECCANACRPAAEGVCDDIDSDGIPDTWVPFGR